MVGMNGIPQPVTPQRLAQRVADLERMVEQLTSSRTYVNIGNIVEGGTINENVGTALTETVQKEIVIGRENLAEAALTDVVVTGSISSRGKTSETVPRDIDVRMTTVARSLLGGDPVPNPAVIFITKDVEEANFALAPGFYSPDGKSLNLRTAGLAGGGSVGLIDMSPEKINVVSDDIKVGPWLGGGKVTIGVPETIFGGPTNVSLVGSVKVNGRDLSYVPPTLVAPINGFAHYNASGWSGIRYAVSNGLVEVTGAYTKASYGSQEVVGVLPIGARPSAKKKGTNVEISAAGEILTAASGSGPTSFGITFIL